MKIISTILMPKEKKSKLKWSAWTKIQRLKDVLYNDCKIMQKLRLKIILLVETKALTFV